jgi:hypothetical protein
MSIEFCPELQINWELEAVHIKTIYEIQIALVEHHKEEYPDHSGRHGKDVISWPTIFKIKNRIEVFFDSCLSFNIREEFSPCFSEKDSGEGRTFQRLFKSEYITMFDKRGLDSVFHYRFYTLNEVIDVVSKTPPTIIKSVFT